MPMPSAFASLGLRTATSLPFLRILPASGWYKPNSTLISVLLPAPFSPSRACTSPLRSCRVISSFALIPGNSLVMWSISITKSSANLLTLLSCRIDTYTILSFIIPDFRQFAHGFFRFWQKVQIKVLLLKHPAQFLPGLPCPDTQKQGARLQWAPCFCIE